MPRHDPVPPRRPREAWAAYRRLMKRMALVAVAAALLALLYLRMSGVPLPIHVVIATFLGVTFTILLGTGLMGLVFLSNSSGHDEEADRANLDLIMYRRDDWE